MSSESQSHICAIFQDQNKRSEVERQAICQVYQKRQQNLFSNSELSKEVEKSIICLSIWSEINKVGLKRSYEKCLDQH